MISNWIVLKKDSLSIDFEDLVVKISGISIFLPLKSPPMMVVVEHMTNLDMPENIGSLHFTKRKKFGRSTMSYYKPKAM